MAFDLPTQLGRDSDDPLCDGEVGRTGVPIDTIEDMRICFDEIPLDQVSTSMTINAPAAVLLLLYELVGEEQGVPSEKLRGTVQNDVLKEYVARGNYIYPPEPTMRLTTDIFEYCHENVPKWNTISISGYHIREKGCSAVQEVAFTLSNAIAYVEAALDRGLDIDEFAPRLAFFFNCHNNVFQEIAKFRAVRRMWARIVRERFGSESERSQMIRFHTQTGGVTLQAQQPEVNIIRVALQGFAAVCGGTQSLHTNGFDEALALPTERSARIALRTQQVIAHESGRRRHRRPVRRLLLRRVADRRDRDPRVGADRARSASSAARSRRSTSSSARSRSRRCPTTSATRPARTSSSASTSTSPTRSTTSTSSRSTRRPSARQKERLAKFKADRDQAARRAPSSRSCARSPGATATCCCRSAQALAATALDRRGLRCDAGCVRRVQGRGVFLGLVASSVVARRSVTDEIVVAGWDRAAGERGWRQNHALMESKAKRTLVKSAPELWELADDPARMQSWMSDLVGGGPVLVEVTDRDPERILAWRVRAARRGRQHRDRACRERLRHRGADHRPALARRSGQGDRRAGGAAR